MDRLRFGVVGRCASLSSFGAVAVLCVAAGAEAASHPPGVPYPLTPAAVQPSGLAQALPSTRRYVLVWKDQLADAVQTITAPQKDFIVTHYVGTQKVFQAQIDEYRQKNPNFLCLVYHVAYGLNGADQANPVGNITGANRYGQEDTDTFTPYVAAHSLARENAYQHTASPASSSNRVSYPDPYWLMDVSSSEWRSYLYDTLIEWQGYPATKATGVFLDVAFFPWYAYQPDAWWAGPAGGASRQALRDFWNPRARDYYDAMRAAFAATAAHPRYLVIPNTDALVDGTDEPAFLTGTDGVFTENWQVMLASAGDWNLSARRIAKYATSAGKVWMADVTQAGTALSQAEREQIIGTYLLIRNGTSYIMLGNSDITWYPEYELDLGAYDAEPPADLEDLRVAGNGGAQGGLYLRSYASGLVLVNSSDGPLSYTVPSAMKRAAFSGGGDVGADGALPAFALTYDADVAAGPLQVPAHSVALLRVPTGAPPAGEEPGGGGDGGTGVGGAASTGGAGGGSSTSSGGSVGQAGGGASSGGSSNAQGGALAMGGAGGAGGGVATTADAGLDGAPTGGAKSGDSGGCGCRVANGPSAGRFSLACLGLLAGLTWRRRRARR